MGLRPLYEPQPGRAMRVAAFMSGSGTNILRLLEHAAALRAAEGIAPYEVVFIFSDRSDGACAGERIALDYGLPYFSFDTRAFHRRAGYRRTVRTPAGLTARRAYDAVARTLVAAFRVHLIALGGYMSYTTLAPCVNVHPADLSVRGPDGSRRYVGDNAVYDAIAAGETSLRASTLWTDEGVDTGPLLMVSRPLPVELPCPIEELREQPETLKKLADAHQQQLKEIGDWKIFPRTVELIARGRMALDAHGTLHMDGRPRPDGYRE